MHPRIAVHRIAISTTPLIHKEKSMSEKTVSSMVVRIMLDATEEILGTNGLKALLNYAGLISLFENKPGYTLDKSYTNEEYSRLTASWLNILGTSGGKAIFRVIGKSAAKRSIASGIFESLKDLSPRDRLSRMVEIFGMAIGRGKALRDGDAIVFDNPECTACSGLTSDTPICTGLIGSFDEYAAWAGVEGGRTVETKCKAKGDETCCYEIRPV
jgi:predicted hydrocarbon binding protein